MTKGGGGGAYNDFFVCKTGVLLTGGSLINPIPDMWSVLSMVGGGVEATNRSGSWVMEVTAWD